MNHRTFRYLNTGERADTPAPKGKRVGWRCPSVDSKEPILPPEHRWGPHYPHFIRSEHDKPFGFSALQSKPDARKAELPRGYRMLEIANALL